MFIIQNRTFQGSKMKASALVLISLSFASGTPETVNGNFMMFPPLPIDVINTSNALCREQSELYIDSLQNFTLWASEMWDATAKSTTGLLRGNMYHLGNFEQCLSARAPFQTKYCLATIKATFSPEYKSSGSSNFLHSPFEHAVRVLHPKRELSNQERGDVLRLGWCVPASCRPQELQTHLQRFIDDFDLPLKAVDTSYSAEISEADCQTSDGDELEATDVLSFGKITLVLVLLVSTATQYEISSVGKKHLLARLLLCFSAKENWRNLVKIGDRNPSLAVVDGIKACTIVIIIISHEFLFVGLTVPSTNGDYIERLHRKSYFGLLFHLVTIVDTLFLVSGILASYTILRQLSKGKSPLFLFCSRYMRTTPSLGYVILFYASTYRYMGSGPLWNYIVGREVDDCKENWWTNMLYINNYINSDHMCLLQSWFLACIFHYYVLSIFMCLLLKKNEKLGLISLLAVTVVSVVVNFTVILNHPPYFIFTMQKLRELKTIPEFLEVYIGSHTRAIPFFIGTLAGYCYYKEQLQGGANFSNFLTKINSSAILLASTCLIVASYLISLLFFNPTNKCGSIESALFGSLSQIVVSSGTLGIMYAAGRSKSGIPYKFLCSYPFTIISKLAFGAFLVHLLFMYREAGMAQGPQLFSIIDLAGRGAFNLLVSYTVSLVIYILVEEPFRRIPQTLTSSTPSAKDVSNGIVKGAKVFKAC